MDTFFQICRSSGSSQYASPPLRHDFAIVSLCNSGVGRSGAAPLSVDGEVVSRQKLERTGVPLLFSIDETFDFGSKTETPIDDRYYQVLFTFTGKINELTVSVEPPVLTAQDQKNLSNAFPAAQDAK